tara:strand:- start:11 stop:631 length:621 start_codon:yes stop_codon:yes gene_type:complete
MTGFKTIVVTMPIHQNPEETNRGIKHCSWLNSKYNNIEILNIDLTDTYNKFVDSIPEKFNNKLALANLRARIRMSALYTVAGNSNGIVVGTGNKIEDFGVGFFTKYGDGGVDISPIADLMKSEVYDLGKRLNIINEIMIAKPTDGLWDDGRTDEDQLGVSYDELEWAMEYNGEEINERQKEILNIYKKHRNVNLHKMKNIPIFKKK